MKEKIKEVSFVLIGNPLGIILATLLVMSLIGLLASILKAIALVL